MRCYSMCKVGSRLLTDDLCSKTMVLSLLTEYEKGLETESSFIIIHNFYGNP